MGITRLICLLFIVVFSNSIIRAQKSCLAPNGKDFYCVSGYNGVDLYKKNGAEKINRSKGLEGKMVISIALCGSNVFVGTEKHGLFVSKDEGASWSAVDAKLEVRYDGMPRIFTIAVLGSNILLGTYCSKSFKNVGIYISNDGGETWYNKSSGIGKNSIVTLATDGENFYAGVDSYGLFKSTDLGLHWTDLGKKDKMYAIESIFAIGQMVFASANVDYYLSEDGGKSWMEKKGIRSKKIVFASDGREMYGIESICVAKSQEGKYWPCYGEYIYGITDILIAGSTIYAFTEKEMFSSPLHEAKWTKPGKEKEYQREMASKDSVAALQKSQKAHEEKEAAVKKAKEEKQAEINKAIATRQRAIEDSINSIRYKYRNAIDKYFEAKAEVEYENYPSAIGKFNEALVIKPDFIKALQGLANCYNKMKKYEEEKSTNLTLEKINALSKYNDNSLFRNEFSDIDYAVKDSTSRKHLAVYYKDDKSRIKLAEAYLKNNQLTEAVNYYNEANKINPKNPKYEEYSYSEVVKENCPQCEGKTYYWGQITTENKIYGSANGGNVIGSQMVTTMGNVRCEKCWGGKVSKKIYHSAIRKVK